MHKEIQIILSKIKKHHDFFKLLYPFIADDEYPDIANKIVNGKENLYLIKDKKLRDCLEAVTAILAEEKIIDNPYFKYFYNKLESNNKGKFLQLNGFADLNQRKYVSLKGFNNVKSINCVKYNIDDFNKNSLPSKLITIISCHNYKKKIKLNFKDKKGFKIDEFIKLPCISKSKRLIFLCCSGENVHLALKKKYNYKKALSFSKAWTQQPQRVFAYYLTENYRKFSFDASIELSSIITQIYESHTKGKFMYFSLPKLYISH